MPLGLTVQRTDRHASRSHCTGGQTDMPLGLTVLRTDRHASRSYCTEDRQTDMPLVMCTSLLSGGGVPHLDDSAEPAGVPHVADADRPVLLADPVCGDCRLRSAPRTASSWPGRRSPRRWPPEPWRTPGNICSNTRDARENPPPPPAAHFVLVRLHLRGNGHRSAPGLAVGVRVQVLPRQVDLRRLGGQQSDRMAHVSPARLQGSTSSKHTVRLEVTTVITKRSEHITPALKSLHWLPVSCRIDFKVLLLVYKSLNGLGPEYMSDILVEYKPSRALRSTDSGQIVKPRVQTNMVKQRLAVMLHKTGTNYQLN
ncbi:hypothetical protein N1851_015262 [Merluccius polli]|uniref:Uncharacterized protein n=1 Tax=Merluccius polli TaxID=89951 RepID=A0AA47MSP3_MERPO|nr:hypothetical protein N1851_015262 [Merluccius polli]